MKKTFTFLLMALLTLAGFKSWGQETITVDFESGIPSGWTTIDADGDGNNWTLTTGCSSSGSYSVVSESYRQVLYPDNFLVSPQLTLGTGASISFYAYSYGSFSEHIGLAVSTSGTNPSDFTVIQDWTYYNAAFNQLSVDLNAYAGQQVYLAIRHYNVSDQWKIYVDDITINLGVAGTSYNISYDNANIQHGSISGPATAYAGQTVTLTATPDANYALGQFIVDGSPIDGNTFIMPENDVTVSATFVPHYTLTVNDGTNTNSCVPIYGYFADATCKSQFIIPASALGDMLGGTVSDMTFYLNSSSSISFTGTWDVYVKEVDNTTLSGFVSWSELGSAVYHGNMTITNGQLTVNFTAPITYNGNNLLIGFNETVSGNCPSTSWLGVSQSSNTAWYSTYNGAGYLQQFLPKTTFDYTPNPNLHHITVTQPAEGGTISAPAAAISGNVVTLTATPELGYAFGEWITDPAVEIIDNQFVMPSSDITVTATFESAGEMYTITLPDLDPEIITGIDALFNSEHVDQAPEGTEITLVYATLNEGYIFNYWTLNGTPLPSNTFNMPAGNVVIDINLTERPRYAVIIDESIVNGTVEADPNTDILGGTQVTLTITPDTYYRLASLTVTDGSGDPVTVTNNKFSMPESNATVTATFEYHPTLTVNDGTTTQPNGYGNVQIPFAGYYADGTTKSQFIIPASDLTAMIDATITDLTFYLTAPQNKDFGNAKWDIYLKEVDYAAVGYSYPEEFANNMTKVYSGKLSINNYLFTIHFDTPFIYGGQNLMIGFNQTTSGSYVNTTWLGAENGTDMRSRGSFNSTNASFNFLPKTTFDFTPGEHRYNITTVSDPVAGGTVTTDQTNNKATAGTLVTLTATPEFGYAFGEWTTDPEVEIVDNQFEMPESDITVTATFTPVESYAISPNLGEYEGLVDVAAKYNDETITEAPAGTEVTLEYTNLNEGYTFNYWTLNGEQLTGNTFTMPATDVEIGVNLSERPRFAVSIDGSIANGTITANPSTNILGNTIVTLTITPATGYGLGELTVTDGSGNSVTVNNNQFSMPESNVTVTATFVPALTVYDGTATQHYAPVYTYYGDTEGSASQFMVPASLLEDMQGGTINSMKFYISSSERLENLETASYKGYIKEINSASMNNTFIFDDAANIFDGTLSLTNNNTEVLITFSSPYTYNGGNLVIAFECTESEGAWTKLNYYSSSATGGIIYRNGSATSTNTSNYVPKTTFLYTPVTPYTVNLHVNGVVSEEEVSSLPTPENIPAGMTFCGWTSSDIATYTTEAPSYVTKATADGEDLYAVFSYSEDEPAEGGEIWQKVTDASDLSAGDEIVLVYDNMIMCNRENATYMDYPVANVTISSDVITELPANAAQFTLVANGDYWNLQYEELSSTRTLAANADYEELASQDLFESWSYTALVDFEAQTYNNSVIFKNADLDYYIGYYSEWNQITLWTSTYACAAYKKSIPMITTTYYMTEVLTDGEVAANTTAKNIIITTGIVTVDNNIVLTMNENGLFRNENAANFVFKDGAELIYIGSETVNATFEKNIIGYNAPEAIGDGWYFIANPTANPTVNLSGGNSYDLYTFDPAAAAEWQNEQYEDDDQIPENEITISRETGYLYANSADFTLKFAGELIPSGEDQTIDLVYYEGGESGREFPGFNLIGNPFSCTAYISGDFEIFKLGDGSDVEISTDYTVAPCEAFFVEATADNKEVTLSTTAPEGKSRIMPIVVNSDRGETLDRAILHLEGTRNSHKFMMNPDRTNISFAKNGERFASVSRGDETEIPMNFTADHKGSYTISFNTENFEEEYLHLIDVVSGDNIDLLVTPSYTFEADADEYASRFRIVFGTTDINDDPATSSEPFVYISNGNLVINNIEGTASMQIVDMLGRIVRTETVCGSYNKPHNLKAGAYVITLDGRAQRIVIE